jgi:hypothetical protein
MNDDEQPTAEELRQAQALARALAGHTEDERPPVEALEAAGLLGFARSGGALAADRAAALRQRLRPGAVAALRPRRRRLIWAWMTAPVVAAVGALVVLVTRPAPPFPGGWPPAPPPLLQAQAAAARGEPGAIGRLDEQMRDYRQQLLARIRPRGGAGR